jgi:hypothetical protein
VSSKSTRAAAIVGVALAVALVAVWRTGRPVEAPSARAAQKQATRDRTIVFDHSSLTIAEVLARMPTSAEEQPFAESALRLADSEMDLAFRGAVRRMENQPKAQTPEVKDAEARLEAALTALTASQVRVASLTAALAKATPLAAEAISDRLDLAKAQAVLNQDEADDARQDLREAGGDPQGHLQEIVDAHEAASKQSDSIHVVVTPATALRGAVSRVRRHWKLSEKADLIRSAQAHADSMARVFKTRHDSLEARVARAVRDSASGVVSHDSSAVLLARAKQRMREARTRAALDQRMGNQRELSATYGRWLDVLAAERWSVVHDALRDLATVLGIILVTLLGSAWLTARVRAHPPERRHAHTAWMVSRVSLQAVAVLAVLLVIFGPPDSFSTVVGLATAGLTVALKDVIIGFLGWFVLMGKHGIRVGDLVEINGVTGQVTEIGLTQTALLETGHWSEAGHPTGRRATFSNGFAISGHFFNFSTDGRWLMDDVRVAVPTGHDPYPIAAALQTLVQAETADWAREAEAQWKLAQRIPGAAAPSAAASVTYKPVMGGVEIAVRFITRPGERDAVRAKLFQLAVDMIGSTSKPVAMHTPSGSPAVVADGDATDA